MFRDEKREAERIRVVPEALDGNSNDFRYIQIRRTLIYIEQSIKNALDPFVFAANTPDTWASVVRELTGLLEELRHKGDLADEGTPGAWAVECGLGTTMTEEDVRAGRLVGVIRAQESPDEAVTLRFEVDLQGAED